MIFHKLMIAGACEIAGVEKENACVLFDSDGTIASINAYSVFVAQATPDGTARAIRSVLHDTASDAGASIASFALSVEALLNLIKAVPIDRVFAERKLENISMRFDSANQSVTCEYNNGKSVVTQRVKCVRASGALLTYRDRLRDIVDDSARLSANELADFVFNRKRLACVVSALDSACKYDGEFSYVTQSVFGRGYIWRVFNQVTKQKIVIAHILPRVNGAIAIDEWEQELLCTAVKKKSIQITLKKKD